jgi:hypothetical protein
MKTLILSLVFLLTLNVVNAQYRSYKDNYNVKTYSFEETDRYNPSAAGVLAIIPGVGHFYSGEVLRGLGFIGGMAGSAMLMPIGFAVAWGGSEVIGATMMLGGAAGFVGIYIWNFIDATKVAKIKNMALRSGSLSFNIEPYFESGYQNQFNSNNIGLSLKMRF